MEHLILGISVSLLELSISHLVSKAVYRGAWSVGSCNYYSNVHRLFISTTTCSIAVVEGTV